MLRELCTKSDPNADNGGGGKKSKNLADIISGSFLIASRSQSVQFAPFYGKEKLPGDKIGDEINPAPGKLPSRVDRLDTSGKFASGNNHLERDGRQKKWRMARAAIGQMGLNGFTPPFLMECLDMMSAKF